MSVDPIGDADNNTEVTNVVDRVLIVSSCKLVVNREKDHSKGQDEGANRYIVTNGDSIHTQWELF